LHLVGILFPHVTFFNEYTVFVRRRRWNSCVMGANDSTHGTHYTVWSRSLSTHTLVAVRNQDIF